jgi:hypothetical protein
MLMLVVVVMDTIDYPIVENHNDVDEYRFHDRLFVDEFHERVCMLFHRVIEKILMIHNIVVVHLIKHVLMVLLYVLLHRMKFPVNG